MPIDLPASTSTRIFPSSTIEYAVTPRELIFNNSSCYFFLRNFQRAEDSLTTVTFEKTIESSSSTLEYEPSHIDEDSDIYIPLHYVDSYKLKVKIKTVQKSQIKIYLD